MSRNIKEIISCMTLEEKASLCSGLDNWHTKSIERLGIPSITMSDGPHGLRKVDVDAENGGHTSVPSTCFPTAVGLACSWNRKLLEKVGETLGKECQALGVDILLGPGANIKRSPLCGRNFEYYSEDPYLASELAAQYIKGVQSQGVGTSLKHYAANNQETRRMTVDAVIDERTLREIYLASFEGAVKQSQPWTVMSAYNKVNGYFCSENKYLLTDILKNEWGHEGFVVSDWGAVNDRVAGMEAGMELEMPSSGGERDKQIVEAVKQGRLSEEVLDMAVERILNIVFKAVDNRKKRENCSAENNKNRIPDQMAAEHHQIAREVARECMVLLKNEGQILPLKREGTIAVIGAFARNPRYQGGESSHVNPTRLDDIYEEIRKVCGSANILYAEGYRLDSDEIDEKLIAEAKNIAAQADVCVIFAGLPEHYESEGYDRQHMRMPENHNRLIEAVAEVNPDVVVVLSNGAPVEMPWIDKVKGILEAYLGGQALGGAIADILFGNANPCGKLAETFPMELSHNPSYLNFPGEEDRVEYREGLFVGYRYYEKKKIKPLFPFGHGLSYTEFEYVGISVDKKEITDRETVNVTVKVKNKGKMAGKEIIQLYVRDTESTVIRPEKELKGFEKIELQPGEEKEVNFTLGKRAFAYYNTELKDWHVESGDFEIMVGPSSAELPLKATVKLKSTVAIHRKYHENSTFGDIAADPSNKEAVDWFMKQIGEADEDTKYEEENFMHVLSTMMKYTPVRAVLSFRPGKVTQEIIRQFLEKLNNKPNNRQ